MDSTHQIAINLISSFLFVVLFATFRYARQMVLRLSNGVARFNDRWGLALAQRELSDVQALSQDPAAFAKFGFSRLFLWLSIFSVGLMIGWLGLLGLAWLAIPFAFLVATALYLVALHTFAVMSWSGQPQTFVPIVHGRIDRLERRLAAAAARTVSKTSSP